jgi:uncharacterized protein (DUF58 family)
MVRYRTLRKIAGTPMTARTGLLPTYGTDMSYPTPRALLLASVVALLAVVSVLYPWLSAFGWLGVLVLLALLAVDLRASVQLTAPVLTRSLPARARLHEPCRIRYALGNPGNQPLDCRLLLDELPHELGGDVRIGPQQLLPGAVEAFERVVTPVLRGNRRLGPSFVYVASPLGLFARRHAFAHDGQMLGVYPASAFPEHRGLSSRSLLHELGLRPRRPRGTGAEFESLREYTPDDEPRRIDWRASARSQKPVVRDFHTERNHTIVVAVDCGRLMAAQSGGASKLDHALAAAVSLVRACAQGGDRIGFIAFDEALRAWVPPQRPARALAPILEATLALAPRACEPSYRVLANLLQERQKKRALIVLLTDFVEGASTPGLEAYLSLLARRHCVLLVGIRDRLLREVEAAAPEVAGLDIYRRLVLQDLDVARQAAVARITRTGVQTLDLDATQITAPLLDRYLRIREAGLM